MGRVVDSCCYHSVLDCSIIDNHLHSDHVPVTVTFDIDVVHNTVLERTYVTRVAWHKASNDHIDKYKTRLDMLLSNIQYDIEALKCNDRFCRARYHHAIKIVKRE